MLPPPPTSTLFPYTTLFRSVLCDVDFGGPGGRNEERLAVASGGHIALPSGDRSEEHTSELQSLTNLVCRLLLEKKNPTSTITEEEAEAQTLTKTFSSVHTA